jgi:hypothetical protein
VNPGLSERATRPLNTSAVSSADDDLYARHADDPRPNALYDDQGNRKPLSATDPDQADLRNEWMDSYKANGGETESTDTSGTPAGQTVKPCEPQLTVNPLIDGDLVDLDDSDIPEPDAEEEPEEPESPPPDDDEPEADPDPVWEPMAKHLGSGASDGEGDSNPPDSNPPVDPSTDSAPDSSTDSPPNSSPDPSPDGDPTDTQASDDTDGTS